MYLRAVRKDFTAEQHSSLALSRMYWFFVVGLWPLLYVLVYLS
jgi:heme/copper-type cytochrome/quinol oxidase subunit 3